MKKDKTPKGLISGELENPKMPTEKTESYLQRAELRLAFLKYMQNVLGKPILKSQEIKVAQAFSELFETVVLEIKNKEAKNDK
jgi:hypothetical protein